MRQSKPILVMIGYPIDIGFAIGRLISAFYQMALRFSGNPDHVHFSFGRTAGQVCATLPNDFTNLLELDYNHYTSADEQRLCDYIKANSIEILFALDMRVKCPYLAAARRAGVENVVSYWGAPMSSFMPPLKLLMKRLEVGLIRRSKPDYYIFESEAMRAFAVGGRGLKKSRTTVIPTGLDTTRFRRRSELESVVRDKFVIPKDRKIIVFMGHMHERKGVHVLLKAANYLVNDLGRTDIHYLFLGNTEAEARHYMDLLGEEKAYVTLGGYQMDIPEILSGCDIGCVPSTGWDSFPMSSLEMQSCGLPVIASDLQGVPETIVDGVTGIVVPAGDHVALGKAVVSLVDDSAKLGRMASAARLRIESDYTCEMQIARLTNYLNSLKP